MTEALNCPNCGGPINRKTMTCEYCGTQFKLEEPKPYPHLVEIYREPMNIRKVYARTMIDPCLIDVADKDFISDYVKHSLAGKLADALIDEMSVSVHEDPSHVIVTGMIRVARREE